MTKGYSKNSNGSKEFEGYVRARLEDIAKDIKDIKEEFKQQVNRCDARFCKLENNEVSNRIGLAKVGVIIGGVSVVLSIVVSKVIDALLK